VHVILDLDQAGDEMRRAIARSLPDKMDLPTPCEGWTVRNVINHVVTGNLRTLAWTHNGSGPPNEDDHLRDDPLAAFDASFDQVRSRLEYLSVRDVSVQTPFAVLSADELIEMRCSELIVHAWDVARATGQPTDFAPELCERSHAMARVKLEGRDRTESPFGPEQPPLAGASTADRLAAYFGRSV
jgi:uncharacterized protein (TIGR03086 family)